MHCSDCSTTRFGNVNIVETPYILQNAFEAMKFNIYEGRNTKLLPAGRLAIVPRHATRHTGEWRMLFEQRPSPLVLPTCYYVLRVFYSMKFAQVSALLFV